MSGHNSEESTLKKEENNSIYLQRQRQFATLNDDKMNVPKRKQFSFYIEHLIISIFQLLSAYFLYSMYFSSDSNLSKTHFDNQETEHVPVINRNSFDFKNDSASTQGWCQADDSVWNYILLGLIYLCCGLGQYWISSIRRHLKNCKNVSEITPSYNKMRNSIVNLSFNIECYHKEETENGRTSDNKKVVTHTASKVIQFSECYDFSGFMKPEIQKEFRKPYIFIDYLAEYEMLEEKDEKILQTMYNDFVKQNTKDQFQDHRKTFEFTGCESKTQQSYLLEGEKSELQIILLIASLFILIWPVSMLVDYVWIEKYEVIIVKKVKIDENQQGYPKSTV